MERRNCHSFVKLSFFFSPHLTKFHGNEIELLGSTAVPASLFIFLNLI